MNINQEEQGSIVISNTNSSNDGQRKAVCSLYKTNKTK